MPRLTPAAAENELSDLGVSETRGGKITLTCSANQEDHEGRDDSSIVVPHHSGSPCADGLTEYVLFRGGEAVGKTTIIERGTHNETSDSRDDCRNDTGAVGRPQGGTRRAEQTCELLIAKGCLQHESNKTQGEHGARNGEHDKARGGV